MRELPFDLRFELAGKRVRLVHGSPRKVNDYLFEDNRRAPSTASPRSPTATCSSFGHTHNPGSTTAAASAPSTAAPFGKPKDGDARAAFAVLEVHGDDVVGSIKRAAYDALALARDMRTVGLPDTAKAAVACAREHRGADRAGRRDLCPLRRTGGAAAGGTPERRLARG
jgi:hypothetical protein